MLTSFLSSFPNRRRQWLSATLIPFLALAACAGPKPNVGELGAVEGFVGLVAVDEPHAALVAFDILSAGGTAADAAAAAFFTMTVTYPVGAGMGGGGRCVVYDKLSDKAEAIDFMPRPASAGGEIALPTAVRGIASLHARYGRLRWSQIITPAERYARFGHPMSRAFNRRLIAIERQLDSDLMIKRLFLTDGGRVKPEGARVEQIELATALGLIRGKGVAEFYGGTLGRLFVEDSNKLGGRLTSDELRHYIPEWQATKTWEFGNLILHASAGSDPGPRVMASMIDGFADDSDDLSVERRLKVTAAAFGERTTASAGGDAAVAVIDWAGNGVACQFTLGQDLGLRRMLPALGFVPASPRAANGYVVPVLAHNPHLDEAYFAAAASGGPFSLSALAPLIVDVLENDTALAVAIGARRAVKLGSAGEEVIEPAAADGGGEMIGRVQVAFCPSQPTRNADKCRVISDRRGFGLATGAAR